MSQNKMAIEKVQDWLILIVFDVIQGADAEADVDFFTADLKVEFGIETAEEKAKGNLGRVAVNIHYDICRAQNAFGFMQRPQQFLEQSQLAQQFPAKCVFAMALIALDGILAGCVENGETHKRAAILLDASEFKFTSKLQN